MNDKEIRDYIKKQTASILPPESLEPDKIEDKLAEVQQKKTTPFVRRRNLPVHALGQKFGNRKAEPGRLARGIHGIEAVKQFPDLHL